MEAQELIESTNESRRTNEKRIGVTIAIVAVFLAVATMLGHRTHTEEVVLQTRAADQWAFYQARHTRSEMFAADAKLAALSGTSGASLAEELRRSADKQNEGAEELRKEAEKIEAETSSTARRAGFFDYAEVFLQISIVLCSLSLLTERTAFWRVSFLSTACGLAILAYGFVR